VTTNSSLIRNFTTVPRRDDFYFEEMVIKYYFELVDIYILNIFYIESLGFSWFEQK